MNSTHADVLAQSIDVYATIVKVRKDFHYGCKNQSPA